jgi:hypothetical protein
MRHLLIVLLLALPAQADWLTGWDYRKAITIDSTNVDAALTDFPLLVSLASDPNVGTYAQADANDIRFTSSDGTTLLDAELEAWSVDSNEATATMWVRVPSVASDANTVVYVYYGNEAAEAAWDAPGVWDANHVGVWHMADATTSTVSDSTSYAGTGTKSGANSPLQVTGQIGQAQDFDLSNHILIADSDEWDFSASDSFTASAWVQPDTGWGVNYCKIVQKGDGTAGYEWQFIIRNNGNLYISMSGAALTDTAQYITVNEWSHVAWSQSGTSGSLVTYNGVQTYADAAYKPAIPNGSSDAYIGNRYGDDGGFDGTIDEVRVSNIARPATWIKADYHSTAGSLASVGEEEAAPAAGPSPADEATDVSTTATLSWTGDANDYNVYFGRVDQALKFMENTNSTSISLPMGGGIEYQWRIDPNDPNLGATTGDVLTFTTEPNYTLALTGATGVESVTPKFTFSSGTIEVYIDDVWDSNLVSGSEANISLGVGEVIEYRCSAWSAITLIDIRADKVAGSLPASVWPGGLTTLYGHATSLTGDVSSAHWPGGLVTFYGYSTSMTGDVSTGTWPAVQYLSINNTAMTYGTGGAASGVTSSLVKIDADDCGWDYLTVNRMLADLVASGISGKALDIAGTNAGPSQTGDADRATLVTRSWTLSINATEAQAPFEATYVGPADGATDIELTQTLSWGSAYDASDYNVYLNASLAGNTSGTTYDPDLDYDTTYTWRIDPNDPDGGATTGDTWSFTTEAAPPEDPEEPTDPEEPVEPVIEGWRKGPAWNRTPQWRKHPVWRKR